MVKSGEEISAMPLIQPARSQERATWRNSTLAVLFRAVGDSSLMTQNLWIGGPTGKTRISPIKKKQAHVQHLRVRNAHALTFLICIGNSALSLEYRC
jgi:hypothetical protein